MRMPVAFVMLLIGVAATNAQDAPPQIKMLTPTECSTITKKSEAEIYIKGPVQIGNATFEASTITRGVSFNGVDYFDVIVRSCFVGKPL